MNTDKPQGIKDKVWVWWDLYHLILNDEEVQTRLKSRLDQSRSYYRTWGDVLGQTYDEWWKDFGSGLFLKRETVQRLTSDTVQSLDFDDPETFAVVVSVGATPALVARTIKSMYRRHVKATSRSSVGRKWRVRIPVYEVRMRWFCEVGRESFLGRLKGNALITETRTWFRTNASWINAKGYPMENWAEPRTPQDWAKQRTMTYRVDKFMRDALTLVAEGKFL
jgi:hypothetical protein